MNGIHDLGGLTCFGPIDREDDEPVFHDDWERRVFALSIASSVTFGPIDRRRHALETLDPVLYLSSGYYERWLARLENLAIVDGLLTEAELAGGKPSTATANTASSLDSGAVESIVREGRPTSRDTGRVAPRFSVGERVRARNMQPAGHTRLPRYVRNRVGVVERLHGSHCFPDTNAHGQGENPQPLYSVGFDATELWGNPASSQDRLFIDLWEDYLEPAAR
jgi:nitrile hydratase